MEPQKFALASNWKLLKQDYKDFESLRYCIVTESILKVCPDRSIIGRLHAEMPTLCIPRLWQPHWKNGWNSLELRSDNTKEILDYIISFALHSYVQPIMPQQHCSWNFKAVMHWGWRMCRRSRIVFYMAVQQRTTKAITK